MATGSISGYSTAEKSYFMGACIQAFKQGSVHIN